MLNKILQFAVYALLLLMLYFTKAPMTYIAGLAAAFVINIRKGDARFLLKLAAPAAVGVYLLLINQCFKLYLTDVLPAFYMFTVATAAMLVNFHMISEKDGDMPPPEFRAQKPAMAVFKSVSALALGIGAWLLLKKGWLIPAILVYGMCFIQLLLLFSQEKAPAEETAASGAGADATGAAYLVEPRKLFSVAAVLMLVMKMYFSFMSFNYKETLILFVIAAFIAGVVFPSWDGLSWGEKGAGSPKIEWLDILAMAGLFAVAFYIRIRHLELPGACSDDTYMMNTAHKMLLGYNSVFEYDATILGPSLIFYMIKSLLPFTHGQMSVFTARILAVIVGSLGVVTTYLLALELFKRRVAVIAGFITSVLFIMILYGRLSFWCIEVVTFSTISFYFFARAMRNGGVLNWILSGAGLGFGLYFYNPAKLAPIAAAVFVLMYVLVRDKKRDALSRVMPGFMITVLTAIIVYYPILEYAVTNPKMFFIRIDYTSIFKNIHSAAAFITIIVSQIALTAQVLFISNFDYSGIFAMPGGQPIINGLCTFLFLLGFTAIAFRWKKNSNLMVLVFLAVGLVPGMFSWYYAGAGLRSLLALPPLILIMALGLEFAVSGLEKALGNPMKIVSPLLVSAVLFFVGYTNINDYFTGYLKDPLVDMRWNGNVVRMAKFISGYKNCQVYNSLFYNEPRVLSFYDIVNSYSFSPASLDMNLLGLSGIYNNTGKNVMILAESMNEKNMSAYREYFPNAEIRVHYNLFYWIYARTLPGNIGLYGWRNPAAVVRNYLSDNITILPYDIDANSKPYIDYVSCYIPYDDIKKLYGFSVSYFESGKPAVKGASDGRIKLPGIKCDRVVLEGEINAESYGNYSFSCDGADRMELYVDGQKCAPAGVTLMKGQSRIKAVLYNIKKAAFNVNWKKAEQPAYKVIEYKDVIQSDKTFGLICKKTCEGKVYYLKDYTMRQRAYWWWKADESCTLMDREWHGYLNVSTPGNYEVTFQTAYDGQVTVNGVKAFERKNNKENIKEVFLQAGRNRILVGEKNYQVYNEERTQLLIKKRGEGRAQEVTYDQLSY